MAMSPLFQLVFILVVGTLCQILGWRTKLPSILLLLVAGIVAGPGLGWLAPDALFGGSLMPLVELAVAVILFEGGLSLKRTELGQVGAAVFRLITISAVISWILLSALASYLLGLPGPVALLLGAILVVSGPTVVIPLLRLIRARSPVEPILRWEGILIDPIGVMLAVLVAEVCEVGIDLSAPWHILVGIMISLSVGLTLGWVGAFILKITVGRHLLPDHFIVPLSLAVLFSLVVLSNVLHEQSGLLTSTVMGIVIARNKSAWVQTIEDFIGDTQRMFIGVLFVILAARLDPKVFDQFDLSLGLFILIAIVAIRPLAVLISTAGTKLKLRDRLAISALAPRGIVSAALASSLGTTLVDLGIPGVELLVPYTFATIIGTVTFYGVFSPFLFKLLGVQQNANEGVLIVGGGRISLAIAKVLATENFRVVFIDTNESNIRGIRRAGLEAYQGSILSEGALEAIGFEGIGNLLAFTPNDEANSLAAIEFSQVFGAGHVFQVALPEEESSKTTGRIFAHKDLSLEKLEELWRQGYRPFIRAVPETDEDSEEQSPKESAEYILAEIQGKKLHIVAKDRFKEAVEPEKQVVFGLQQK